MSSPKLLLAMAFLVFATTFAVANDVYIAQTAAGGNTGADCADAHAVAFFNSPSNWGSSAGQIGPGTTLHLCGTFTGTAGSTMLTIQGSGAAGSPVTIQFEVGADLTAPYWSSNGAITCSGQSYITINGNSTGTIQNTANGDNLTYQQPSKGIYFSNCSNIEVKNFTGTGSISNIYQRGTGHSSNGVNTYAVYFDSGCDHIKADNNAISNARSLIFTAYSTVTDEQIFNNTLDYSSWMIIAGDDNSNDSLSGYYVYGNTLGPHFDIWLDAAQTMHADGVMVFAANSGSSATAQIYNNFIQGDMCSDSLMNCTGYIYVQGNHNTYIFNNLIVAESGSTEGNIVVRGNSPGPAPSNNQIYNNTIVGISGITGIKNGGGNAGTGLIVKNNIFSNLSLGLMFGPNSLGSLSASDDNDFYAVATVASYNDDSGPPTNFVTLANWQAKGFDPDSTTGNPNLGSNYTLQTGSAAIGLGADLTSLDITPLDSDMAGVSRPATGAWASGAYQGTTVAPPSDLTATVQ